MTESKINILTALAEVFGRKLEKAGARLYVAALSDLSDEQASQAAAIATRRCKFFPSPCELIELARTGGTSYEAQALVAFQQLENALDANNPRLMTSLVAAIARQLGDFEELRVMPLDEFRTWKRKAFLSAYVSLVKENPQRLASLEGPSSSFAMAVVEELATIPTRQQVEHTEACNRRLLVSLSEPSTGT